jgi:hypothetical protein
MFHTYHTHSVYREPCIYWNQVRSASPHKQQPKATSQVQKQPIRKLDITKGKKKKRKKVKEKNSYF